MPDTNRRLNRLTISRHDFEKCRDLLAALQAQAYGTLVYEGVLLSALVFYSRPFSCNERGNVSHAENRVDAAVLDNLTVEERALHDQILTLRNKAVAHAEWQKYPTNITSQNVIQSMPFSIWLYFKGKNDVASFNSLVDKVLLRAHHLTGIALKTAGQ